MPLKYLLFILLLIIPIRSFGQSINSIQQDSITIVAIENDLPFSTTLLDGSQVGYYIDFWELWSKENNIPVNIILTDFTQSLELVKNNKAIHAGLFINDDRKKWADFSIPINNIKSSILYNTKYKVINHLEELKGQKVGVAKNSFQANFLETNYPEIKLVYFPNISSAVEMLVKNNITAIVDERVRIVNFINKSGLMDFLLLSEEDLFSNTLHVTFSKGNRNLIDIINNGIENISISELNSIEKKWFPWKASFFKDYSHLDFLTLNEQQWLKNNNEFSFVSQKSWLPFEYIDEKNNYVGINADYMSYLSLTLGITFNRNKALNWSEGYQALRKDEIDILSHVVTSSSRALDVITSEPFFDIPGAIVVRKSNDLANSLEQLNNLKVGSISRSYLLTVIKKDYQNIDAIEFESITEALHSLETGAIDAVVASLPVINFEMLNAKLNNLIISGIVSQNFKLSIAVSNSNKQLIPIINKTLDNMENSKKIEIHNKWLSVQLLDGFALKEVIYWSIPILSILITIILFVGWMNLRLKSEIANRETSEQKQKLLQNQLFQSQKMEAVGQLTGGIAHDFNNLLGIILGYSFLLKNKYKDQKELVEYLNEIHFAGERGKSLTSKILSFSKKQTFHKKAINIKEIITGQYELLQKTLTVRIKLVIDCNEELWPVLGDKNEFEDCILNVCINSMHALKDTLLSPTITIRALNISKSSNEKISHDESDREYVQISISDNGCGMDQQTKEKIFEPFYTTKKNQGTGLGLSQVYGIVKRFNGVIHVDSMVDHGTEFIIRLPRFYGIENIESKVNSIDEKDYSGDESILIVDDEISLVNLAAEILSEEKYKVYKATNATEAIDIIKNNSINLLLTDIIMPDIDGYQLAKQALEINSAIKVQFVSGFSNKQEEEHETHFPHNNILHKPYTEIDLLKSIRNLLDT